MRDVDAERTCRILAAGNGDEGAAEPRATDAGGGEYAERRDE